MPGTFNSPRFIIDPDIAKARTPPTTLYTDPQLFAEIKEKLFAPSWQFIGHTDTVHVDGWREHWAGTEREDPFGAPVIDGQIWGRGSGDLKAGICTSLAALSLLDKAGIRLKGDLAFAYVGGSLVLGFAGLWAALMLVRGMS